MPKGPKGEKRPADVIGAAIMVAKIATGELKDTVPSEKRKAGKNGAKSRAKKLTPERRKAIAQKAARPRWARESQG
jgi:hypothetical protein